ncbi:SdrD B-like domain-containing protein, partial [Portibacter marinus]|uniref:SdrD B-like domain-containing protein n=1 Tax=Portibacter marinus TaxID=2898660 RepID=UPI0029E7E028
MKIFTNGTLLTYTLFCVCIFIGNLQASDSEYLNFSCPNNVINDGDLESDDIKDAWHVTGNVWRTSSNVYSGDLAVGMNNNSGLAGIFQKKSASPGQYYEFSAYGKSSTGNGNLGIRFLNSSHEIIADYWNDVTSANFQEYTLAKTAPSGTAYVEAYALITLAGTFYSDAFCLTLCNNISSGGTIGTDQSVCGSSYDPDVIQSVSNPSGGSGNIEYLWMKSTVTCNPPESINDPNWTIISGASGASYDPGNLTESTCYIRCSRREGCEEYTGESNVVTIELNTDGVSVHIPEDNTSLCSGDQIVLQADISNASSCGTQGISDCNHTLYAHGGWVENPSDAAYCGQSYGAKLWTRSGEGTSFVEIDFGQTYPAGTQICVNMKLEHCSNTSSTHSDAKIQIWNVNTNSQNSIKSSETFGNTSYQEFCYTIPHSTRYAKISDNGKCAFRVDYVRVQTEGSLDNSVAYSWSGPGIVGSNTNSTVTIDEPGTYSVIVTDCNGCQSTDAINIINNVFTAEAGVDQAVCEEEMISLTASAVSGASYEWRKQGGSSILSTNRIYTFTPTESATYLVTVKKGGCQDSDDVHVTVNIAPHVTIDEVSALCVGGSAVQLSASPSGGTFSGQSVNSSGLFTPSSVGNKVVTYTYSENGCEGSAEIKVEVKSCEDPEDIDVFNDCGSDLAFESSIKGLQGGASSCASISNSGNVNRIIASVWIERTDCNNGVFPDFITLSFGGNEVNVQGISVTQSPNSGVPEKLYRYIYNGSASQVCVTNENGCEATSLALFVERNEPNATSSLKAYDIELDAGGSSTSECITSNLMLGASDLPRDIKIQVPIHEKDNSRSVMISVKIKDGSGNIIASDEETFTTQNAGVEAAIYSMMLENVAGNATVSEVKICSPANTGDSFGIGGVVATASNGCITCDLAGTVNGDEICTGENATITAIFEGGNEPLNYHWSTGASSSFITVSPENTTTYSVTVTDANGCTAEASGTVVVNEITEVTLDPAGPFCITDDGVQLAGSPEGGNYNGTGVDANGFFTPSSAGIGKHTITYRFSNGNCTTSASIEIIVNPTPSISADNDGPLTSEKITVQLSANSDATDPLWAWTGPGNFTSNEQNPTTSKVGSYTVTVTDQTTGCTNSAVTEVKGAPQPPTPPMCEEDDFTWNNNIVVSGTSVNGDIMLKSQETSYLIPTSLYPSEFGGPVIISIPEAISYDGYSTRSNAAAQLFEQWKVVFITNGNVSYETGYTEDIEDGVVSAEWIGSLMGEIYFPDGVDEIYIIHYEDATYGEGSKPTANSVFPSSICFDFELCDVVAEAIAEPNSICQGEDVTITASATGGDASYTYQWNGDIGTEQSVVIQSLVSTTTYSVTVTDGVGCSDVAEVTVVVNDNPVVSIEPVGPLCSNDQAVQIIASPAGGTFSGIGVSDSGLFDPAVAGNGIYTITYDITTDKGCSDSKSIDIVVNEVPSVVASADPDPVCSGGSVTLTAEGSGGDGSYTFEWSDNLGSGSTIEVENVTSSRAYSVTVTDGNGCTSSTMVNINIAEKATIGDYVFEDLNNNGFQDADDEGIDGITVTLFNSEETQVANTVTQNGGAYRFEVCAGEYYIVFGEVENAIRSPKDQTNDTHDSDADENGKTDNFVVSSGQVNNDIDAGYSFVASIGDYVWLDADADGIQDDGEEGIGGVTVSLTDENGNPVEDVDG